MIKYIGSKRRLVPVLARICQASGARTALDLFTGTTRVAQAFKAQGVHVTAVDSARYAHTFARTYIETDAAATDAGALRAAVTHLNALPGKPGYVTETFSHQARFFQPHNAARIDAVRDAIDSEYAGSPLFPLLLTSLIEAADRVDSTTGVQMAYVKQWAPRSAKPLELRVPELLDGPGRAIQGDAVALTIRASGRPGRTRALRPGVPGSAVQPAPVFHQLPRVGDAGGLGRARGLRRGPQAARCPRPIHALRLQLEADDAGGAGVGGAVGGLRPARAVLQQRVVAGVGGARGDVLHPGDGRPAAGGDGGGARWRRSPSTRLDTSGPASASSTRPGARSGG